MLEGAPEGEEGPKIVQTRERKVRVADVDFVFVKQQQQRQ